MYEFNKNKTKTIHKGLRKRKVQYLKGSDNRKLLTPLSLKLEGEADSEPRDIAAGIGQPAHRAVVYTGKVKPMHRNSVKGLWVTNTLILFSSHFLNFCYFL